MSDLDLAVRRSKRLERRLRDGLGATGKGLHELTSSVEKKLPADAVRKLRFVATLRNKLVHDLDYERLDDRAGFVAACDEAEREIERASGPGARDSMRLAIILAVTLLLLIVVGMTIAVVMMVRGGHALELFPEYGGP